MVKLLIDYELEDIGINIKCIVLCLNKPILKFNCRTKYEDTAEESIQEVFEEWFNSGKSLKEVCEDNDILEELEE